MKEKRASTIDVLSGLRDQATALHERINVLHAEVLALDDRIAEREQELAAAQSVAPPPPPVAATGRVNLGG